nr:putative ribonuclease H-like domain-containing protein [Tanacetum cinerariifolium]
MESLSPQVVSAAKIPISNPYEFDLWKMRIEQYFLMTDYLLWEVILNGDSPAPTRVVEGVVQPVAPTTAEQRLARKNELKAREKRFGGNKETKKVRKTFLKQQYENFTCSSSESLDQIHDSLPTEWRTHTLIWRNKTDLEEQSLDDLFNSLKIYETEVEEEPTNYALMAFTSSSSSSSDNEPTKQVKPPRTSVKLVETSIPTANLMTAIPKPKSQGNSRHRKACFVCKSLTHLIKDCDYYEKKMAQTLTQNYAQRGNHQQYKRMTLLNLQRHVVPTKVLTKSQLVPITAARPVIDVVPKTHVTRPRQAKTIVTKPHSPPRRHITRSPSPKASNFLPKVTDVKALMVNVVKGVHGKWEWKPKCPILDHANPQHDLKDKGVIDSGCSRHMIGNMSYLSDFEEINDRYVAFDGNPKGGKISGKGKIRTRKLDFEDVYFVKELKLNLFSVLQMCDKKNSVLFTDTECIVLSLEFKLPDENQVLLRVPRENNMYNVDLKNIVPSGDLTCLFAKAILDESNLWFRRLGYINFKTMNKLVKGYLVRGLPTKVFKIISHVLLVRKASNIEPLAEAFNTACYVQNRVLVTKPHNKTPYELLHGRTPSIGFTRPFGCPVTILNTLDSLGKFDGKVDEGFLVGLKELEFKGRKPESEVYVSSCSSAQTKKHDDKAMREAKGKSLVESSARYRNLSIEFEDFSNNSINEVNAAGTLVLAVGQIFTNSTNTFSAAGPSNAVVKLEDITYSEDEEDVGAEADFINLETTITVSPIPITRVHKDHHVTQIIGDFPSATQTRSMKRVDKDQAYQCSLDRRNDSGRLVQPGTYNLQEASSIQDAEGHTQEEGIDYEEVFAPVARIEAIRLFLAYASFMGFMMYQIDVKSAFLYENIEEEALYGLHQAPRAWYETLANYLLENGFQRGKIDQTLFIKRQQGNILLVQIYVDDIIFGSTNKDLCKAFKKLMKDKFQMSSMGEPTFFLGLKVNQKPDEIFICQDKYVAEILRKFGLIDGKLDSTPIDTKKPLLKDPDDASEGFDQIIDFLNASLIKYALTVNPNIYVSVIKQFWSSVAVKKVNDVTRLQALVVRKKCMSAKRTTWNEFSSSMASAAIYLSTGDLSSHTTKYTSPAMTHKIFANMRRVGKGRSGVETPLFEGMIVAQQVGEGAAEVNVDDVHAVGVANKDAANVNVDDVNAADAEPYIPSPPPTTQSPPPPQEQEQPSTSQELSTHPPSTIAESPSPPQQQQHSQPDISMDLFHTLLDTCTALTRRVENLEHDKIAKALEIIKLKQWVKKLEMRGIISNIDTDEDVIFKDAKDVAAIQKTAEIEVLSMQDDESEPTKLKEVVEVVTTAKLMTEVVIAAAATITDVATAAAPTLTTAPSAARRRKGIDEVIEQVQRKEKEDNSVMRYQALKRKPQTEAQARKNMMIYLRNMARFKTGYFKGMSYDDIHPIFEKKFNFNIVPNDEDDVYTEATPLVLKVPVVDYEIYTKHNKPYYKIKRADGSHQLYLSFLSMLRNFDREDLEVLWRLVKERFASTKPKNFLEDFLLTTLEAMFEKPDVQAQIWRNQRSVYGFAKRKYPLTRFTLDQMLNNVRLEVEEDSEVSLELLSFGVDAAEDFKGHQASAISYTLTCLIVAGTGLAAWSVANKLKT